MSLRSRLKSKLLQERDPELAAAMVVAKRQYLARAAARRAREDLDDQVGAGESPGAPPTPVAPRGATYLDVWPLGRPTNDVMPHPSGSGRCQPGIALLGDWHQAPRGGGRPHQAQDIFAPRGTAVYAPVSGFVATSTWGENGGWQVTIRGRRAQVLLSHLAYRPMVQEGDQVVAGQQVGVVGNTGSAANTCPHLHIQARRLPGRAIVNIYPDLLALAPPEHDIRVAPLPATDPSTPASSSSSSGSGFGWVLGFGLVGGGLALAASRGRRRRG